MSLNWMTCDYFAMLLQRDRRSHEGLELLVDDLHAEKERTIGKFLSHSGSEDFLWGLVRLLGNDNTRVAGNSAYIIGTLAESEVGRFRVISLTKSKHRDAGRILADLTRMLTFNDSESIMNAAGTMGTLAESHEGRLWMLKEPCFGETLTHITSLLLDGNLWTASNAALVLARISISEEGTRSILVHPKCNHILSSLVQSLGVDEAGRGMNAAFAIGRICDIDIGRGKLLSLPESEKMVSTLGKMLNGHDPGASKNACFALSCLAADKGGHSRILRNSNLELVLKMLSELLSSEDHETGWFAAMTLKTLASQPKGCIKLRENSFVGAALKGAVDRVSVSRDLLEEVKETIEILQRLTKPPTPTVQVLGSDSIQLTWQQLTTKSGLDLKYQVFQGNEKVYDGPGLTFTLTGLQPYTNYIFRVRGYCEKDDGPFSDSVSLQTEECVPGPPVNVSVIGRTATQLKVSWLPPEDLNGILKGYYVYNGKALVEQTQDTTSIISSLLPATNYEIQVCATNSKGKGPKDSVIGTTSELGAHAPSKPEIIVRGRNEMHVSWKPPEVPLGRITRYDLIMDGEVIYSGTEQHHVAHRLRPDKDYTFVVCAITSEGRCESKSTKKRTAKDEYDVEREPLYKPPKKQEKNSEEKEKERERLTERRNSVQVESDRISNSMKKRKSVTGPTTSSSPSSSPSNNINQTASATNIGDASNNMSASPKVTPRVSSAKSTRKLSIGHFAQVVNPSSLDTAANTSKSNGANAPRPMLRLNTASSINLDEIVAIQKPEKLNGNRTLNGTSPGQLPNKPREIWKPCESLPPSRRESTIDIASDVGDPTTGDEVTCQLKTQRRSPQSRRGSQNEISISRSITNLISRSSSPKQPRISKNSDETTDSLPRPHPPALRSKQPQLSKALQRSSTSLHSAVTTNNGLSLSDKRKIGELQNQPLPRSTTELIKNPDGNTLREYSDCVETFVNKDLQISNRIQKNHFDSRQNGKRSSFSSVFPSNQWMPELPSNAKVEHTQNKFVPSQFRTQPANIPGGYHRQVTNLSLFEGGQPKLRIDLVSRSPSTVEKPSAFSRSHQHFQLGEERGWPSASSLGKTSAYNKRQSLTLNRAKSLADPITRGEKWDVTSSIKKQDNGKYLASIPVNFDKSKKLQGAR